MEYLRLKVLCNNLNNEGHAVAQLVQALTMPEGRGSKPDEIKDLFNLPNPSSSTMALGLNQTLINEFRKMFPGSRERQVRKAYNLTATCEPIVWTM
jgi:hypothetical protein